MHIPQDMLIAHQVERAIATRLPKADQITVVVEHGTVTLSGKVANESERQEALSAARNTPGVGSVTNHLLVPGQEESSVGEYLDDTLITTAVKGKLLAEAGIKSFSISVETNQGVVTLTGDVDKLEHATLAEHTAKLVNGVTRVDNRLRYAP